MGNKCCASSSQQTLDVGPRAGLDPKKTRKLNKKEKKELKKKTKKGQGPTASGIANQMDISDDEKKTVPTTKESETSKKTEEIVPV